MSRTEFITNNWISTVADCVTNTYVTWIFLVSHKSNIFNSSRFIVFEWLNLWLLKNCVVYTLISLAVLKFLTQVRQTITI